MSMHPRTAKTREQPRDDGTTILIHAKFSLSTILRLLTLDMISIGIPFRIMEGNGGIVRYRPLKIIARLSNIDIPL